MLATENRVRHVDVLSCVSRYGWRVACMRISLRLFDLRQTADLSSIARTACGLLTCMNLMSENVENKKSVLANSFRNGLQNAEKT